MVNSGRTTIAVLSAAAALTVAGCGVSLTPAGQQVKLVTTAPTDCERIGAVRASSAGGHGEEVKSNAARIELRNQTGELGGDVVHLESEKEQGQLWKVEGVAFQCAGVK